MTFDEAVHKKIHRVRLPFFPKTAFVDPRIIESYKDIRLSPILNPANPLKDSDGQVHFCKVLGVDDYDWEIAGE